VAAVEVAVYVLEAADVLAAAVQSTQAADFVETVEFMRHRRAGHATQPAIHE